MMTCTRICVTLTEASKAVLGLVACSFTQRRVLVWTPAASVICPTTSLVPCQGKISNHKRGVDLYSDGSYLVLECFSVLSTVWGFAILSVRTCHGLFFCRLVCQMLLPVSHCSSKVNDHLAVHADASTRSGRVNPFRLKLPFYLGVYQFCLWCVINHRRCCVSGSVNVLQKTAKWGDVGTRCQLYLSMSKLYIKFICLEGEFITCWYSM